MFRQAGQKPSSDSDDDISLTSTVEDQHGSDEEFVVEDVLAEMESNEGPYYLLKWSGFELCESTWEPEKHLGPEVREMWEETKRKQATGEEQPFDVSLFNEARKKARAAKRDRHRRRNKKRIKLGLPPTNPLLAEEDSSDDEASEEECLWDIIPDPVPTSKQQPRKKDNNEKLLPKLSTSFTKTAPILSPVEKSPSQVEAGVAPSVKPTNRAEIISPTRNSPLVSPTAPRPEFGRTSSTTGLQQGIARKSPKKTPGKTSLGDPIPKPTQAGSGVRVGLKAKKTTSAHKPAGNIFTSGKVRKPRASLKDAMVDESKQARLFSSHHIRRMAELSARAKDDRPPDPDALILFEPSQVGRRALDSSSRSKGTPTSPAVQQPPSQTASLQQTAEAVPSSETRFVSGSYPKPAVKSQSGVGLSTAKKQKSVRFLSPEGEDNLFVSESDPMDLDMASTGNPTGRARLRSPPVPGDQQPPVLGQQPPSAPGQQKPPDPGQQNVQAPQPPKKTSFTEYNAKKTHNVGRTMAVGNGMKSEAVFHGLPRDNESAWFVDFISETTIEFQYVCLAQDVGGQLQAGGFFQTRLAVGAITPRDKDSSLEEVAEFLRSGLLGLYFVQPKYNLIVYPTKCEEWKMDLLGQEPTNSSDTPLRYCLFSTAQDFKGFLRPLPLSSPPAVEDGAPKIPTGRAALMKRSFDFDYGRLLPGQRYRNPKAPQVFFVAFPESRASVMYSVCNWLRDYDANCQIFSAHEAGSWAAFQGAVKQSAGVIIVHELLVWSLRRFPGLSKLLTTRPDEYWCFSDALQPRPVFPSMQPLRTPHPGSLRWTRIFPTRTAIFLTPSFLVSQPLQVKDFLSWYLANRIRDTNFRLVTAWNFHEYLSDLATEKLRARRELTSTSNAGLQKVDVEIEASRRGLGHLDCEALFCSATKAFELYARRVTKAGPYEADEESSPLVFADPSIDPNDEQSLVNWFGWWSTLRMDQFRHFHVVGSGEPTKYKVNLRAERRIRIPEYSRATVNDPDMVLEAVQQNMDDAARRDEAAVVDTMADVLAANAVTTRAFQSQIAQSDHAQEISRVLGDEIIEGRKWKASPWTLYQYPISWLDFEMADHFGDFRGSYRRIKEWFDFTWAFGTRFNTYVGLFYTITEDWNPEAPPTGQKPTRHPWVAIYRPTTPQKYPCMETEVLIWDSSALAKFRGAQKIPESKLLDMQRRVINFIRQEGPKKNSGTHLERVWLGGFDLRDRDQESPFDQTVHFLQILLDDIKTALPPFNNSIANSRGFRPVILEAGASKAQTAESGEPEDVSMSIGSDVDEDDGDKDKCMIFHAPRGTKLPAGQQTKCSNRLYAEARLARAQGKRGEMVYRFRPTLEWYREQEAEGRGFEHINVDSWEGIFKHLHIGSASLEKTTTSAPTSEHRDASTSS